MSSPSENRSFTMSARDSKGRISSVPAENLRFFVDKRSILPYGAH